MNSIEERDNLIGLLQKALEFYSNRENYKGHPSASTCGTPTSLVEMDEGMQARFALDMAQQMVVQNQKMQEDYDKLILETENFEQSGETNPIDLINIFIQSRDDKNI